MPETFDETDAVLARKLAEITPPVDLRARLLAEAALIENVVESRSGGGWWAYRITAAAAVLALLLGGFSLWQSGRGEPISAATADISTFLSNGFTLAMKTDDVGQVREWLAANNPNHAVDLPSSLAVQRPIGCREMMWRGHAGSLACFSLGGGKEAHLAMFPTKAFSDAPGRTPLVASAGKWTSAAWSRDGMTYLLFVPAGMDPVKELLTLGWRDSRFFGRIV
jgi:hypothetical protein